LKLPDQKFLETKNNANFEVSSVSLGAHCAYSEIGS